MAALTLHQNDRSQDFVEHPVEVARRALRDAAELEWNSGLKNGREWAGLYERMASSLPERGAILTKGAV